MLESDFHYKTVIKQSNKQASIALTAGNSGYYQVTMGNIRQLQAIAGNI